MEATSFVMYFLTYFSKISKGVKSEDVADILKKARVKNRKNNITGLLLFRSRIFFQLIEGEKKDVLDIFQKIAIDPRHQDIKVLFEAEIADASRIFPAWSMGLVSEQLSNAEQESLMRSLRSIAATSGGGTEKVLELLRKFSAASPYSAKGIVARTSSMKSK